MGAIKRLLFLLSLGIVGAYFFRSYGFEGIYVASSSMEPTLPQGVSVIVNKFILRIRPPRRGEVVMFDLPNNPKKGFLKRVVAVEGDTVEIKNKVLYLNGEEKKEPYTQHTRGHEILIGDNVPPMMVPKGHVMVLGDNRDVSNDSRDWKNSDGQITPFLPLVNIRGLVRLP